MGYAEALVQAKEKLLFKIAESCSLPAAGLILDLQKFNHKKIAGLRLIIELIAKNKASCIACFIIY